MITQEHFKLLAAYNRWANARLYAAALDLSELSYRLHTGVYFGSLHGTLNHLLLTDRLWLKRLTGEGDLPNDLNAILYEDRIELTKARIAEDNRMIEVTGKYDETALRGLHSYRTTSGMPQSQVLADILLHLFNHQTHHRGQAHACLSILTGGEPPPLDLLAFQRGGAAPNLEKLIASNQRKTAESIPRRKSQAFTVVQQPEHRDNRGDTSPPAACLAERSCVDSNRRD
jgi:uncharacterized damage-inducible protein DinB